MITWDKLYQNSNVPADTNKLTKAQAHRVAEILMLTAKVHRDRDFGRKAHPVAIYDKVNNRTPTTYHRPGYPDLNPTYNWMKVSIGYVVNENATFPPHEVVIVYHLLRHRLREAAAADPVHPLDPKFGFWAVSVGLHPRLILTKFLPPTVDPSNTSDPTVALAQDIATRISADLKSFAGAGDPPGDYAVIYDELDASDIDVNSAGVITATGKNPTKRRNSRIGRLGLIFANKAANPVINLLFDNPEIKMRDYPLSDSGDPIPGWAENHLAQPQIVVTKVKML